MFVQKVMVLGILSVIFLPGVEMQDNIYNFDKALMPFFRVMRRMFFEISGHTSESRRLYNAGRQAKKYQDKVSPEKPFPCDVRNQRSKTRPTSIHKLRVGDIDVIGAMGDSLTAGNGIGATIFHQIITENRGLSWTAGGQGTWREFLTLPNILKEFNPNLFGYATGDSLSIQKAAQFNVAEPTAMSKDMFYMAKELVRRIRNDPRVVVDKDWKLISLMVGPNDFCFEICYTPSLKAFAEKHRQEMIKVFRYIRDNLPRTFINFIMVPNLKILIDLTNEGHCVLTRLFECPCLFGERFSKDRLRFVEFMTEWQDVEREVALMPEFTQNDTFTVVLQEFAKHAKIPATRENKTDNTYLSSDCFHFSQKSDALVANGLWNNLLEPVGNKSLTYFPVFERFLCPTEQHPYIFTFKNSQNIDSSSSQDKNDIKR